LSTQVASLGPVTAARKTARQAKAPEVPVAGTKAARAASKRPAGPSTSGGQAGPAAAKSAAKGSGKTSAKTPAPASKSTRRRKTAAAADGD
jgi:hypothetical protein